MLPATGQRQALQELLAQPDGFAALVGYTYEITGDQSVVVRLSVDDRHRNRLGRVHGGVVAALFSAAGTTALYAADTAITSVANLSMTTNFLLPCPSRIRATGFPERIGTRVAHVTMRLVADDPSQALVASGQAVFALSRASPSLAD